MCMYTNYSELGLPVAIYHLKVTYRLVMSCSQVYIDLPLFQQPSPLLHIIYKFRT